MTRAGLSNILAVTGVIAAFVLAYGETFLRAQTLVLTVSGLRSSDGVVHAYIYDNEGAFDAGSIVDLAGYDAERAEDGAIAFSFGGILPGQYAIMVHHDENANDVFEQSGALPLEGWGYSNNVGQVDIPSFAAAAFSFGDDTQQHAITMIYAN